MLLSLGQPVETVCLTCALPLLYPTWASCSALTLDLLQLNQFLSSCSVLMGERPPFLALKQPHLPHPAVGPDCAQKNPDKEHLFNHPPSSQPKSSSVLWDILSFGFFSVTSNSILQIATTQCHAARPQNFSCFPGSCLCTLSPFFHKQWQDWIPSTQQTGKFLIMPDHRLALSGWEPGQKIKCWGFISINLRGMYRWTEKFLFID